MVAELRKEGLKKENNSSVPTVFLKSDSIIYIIFSSPVSIIIVFE